MSRPWPAAPPGPPEPELPLVDVGATYRVLGLLGRGAFGHVLLGRHPHSGALLALKLVPKAGGAGGGGGGLEAFLGEYRVARGLAGHPCVAGALGGPFQTRGHYGFALELAPARDLHSILRPEVGVPERRVRRCALQLASALDFMGARGLVHGDVKPDNVLLGDAECRRVLLGDFGQCRPVGRPVGCPYAPPTPYAAPELCRLHRGLVGELPAQPSLDAWALGVLLFVALTGYFPWLVAEEADGRYGAFGRWLRGRGPCPGRWGGFSPPALELLRGLLQPRAARRSPPRAALGPAVRRPWLLAAPDGGTAASEGVPAASEGVPVASDGVLVASDRVPVASDGVPMASDGVSVALDGVPVASDGVPVASNGVPVASDGVPVASEGVPVVAPAPLGVLEEAPNGVPEEAPAPLRVPEEAPNGVPEEAPAPLAVPVASEGVPAASDGVLVASVGTAAALEGVPVVSDGVPVASDGVPVASDGVPVASDGVPEEAPDPLRVPEEAPNGVPEEAPAPLAVPVASEGVPVASNRVPVASDGIPAASDGVSVASDRVSVAAPAPLGVLEDSPDGVPEEAPVPQGVPAASDGVPVASDGVPVASPLGVPEEAPDPLGVPKEAPVPQGVPVALDGVPEEAEEEEEEEEEELEEEGRGA